MAGKVPGGFRARMPLLSLPEQHFHGTPRVVQGSLIPGALYTLPLLCCPRGAGSPTLSPGSGLGWHQRERGWCKEGPPSFSPPGSAEDIGSGGVFFFHVSSSSGQTPMDAALPRHPGSLCYPHPLPCPSGHRERCWFPILFIATWTQCPLAGFSALISPAKPVPAFKPTCFLSEVSVSWVDPAGALTNCWSSLKPQLPRKSLLSSQIGQPLSSGTQGYPKGTLPQGFGM